MLTHREENSRPECPLCGTSKMVVPIVYGLFRIGSSLPEAVSCGDAVLGGCCVQKERWHCKRCDHSFPDPQVNDFSTAVPDEKNHDEKLPGQLVRVTMLDGGIHVYVTKTPGHKQYFVTVIFPNGERTQCETESRGKAIHIADAWHIGDRLPM